jgi:hypothetical protein
MACPLTSSVKATGCGKSDECQDPKEMTLKAAPAGSEDTASDKASRACQLTGFFPVRGQFEHMFGAGRLGDEMGVMAHDVEGRASWQR